MAAAPLPAILHMLTPLKHMSPFDVNMAADAGFDIVVPYTNVAEGEVTGLIQDAIFSRGPDGAKKTGVFIGGRDAIQSLDMLAAAREAMFPPFEISLFADPAGSFTTAAAMVACVEAHLKTRGTGLSGQKIIVFGATGVVGFASGVIAGLEGAEVVLVGYDGPERVKKKADEAQERFGAKLGFADGSTEDKKAALIGDATVILAAGRAGTQILSARQLSTATALQVAADVNAVPPAGLEGIGAQDDGVAIPGTDGIGIGALAVGNVKYQVEAGLFRRMIVEDEPLMLDFRDAFTLARTLAG